MWGNTYESTVKPIFILQKKSIRIFTFSRLDCHCSPLFKSVEIIKFFDHVTFHIAILMYKFHKQLVPATFHFYFTKVTNVDS